MFTEADREYLGAEFVALDELCSAVGQDINEVRVAIADRRLPSPPYEGVEFVPANYFDLPDAEQFRRAFIGHDPESELGWYLDGTYFVCLRDATVANVVRKGQLVDEIRGMLRGPVLGDPAWRERLHVLVDELDVLERPFSPDFDRKHYGRPPTRDELIEAPRRHFPRIAAA